MAGSNIGMMDQAFFVGRSEIINWLNDTLQLHISKVEETASGAVACQLMDMIYPGSVPMNKVKWDAKSEYDYIQNYKLLQSAFNKKNVEKHIEVERLIKGKYQDNLEFMQWFKRFWDLNYKGEPGDYDPVERRKKGKGSDTAAIAQPRKETSKPASGSSRSRVPKHSPKKASSSHAPSSTAESNTSNPPARRSAPVPHRSSSTGSEGKIKELNDQIESLQLSVSGLERERDFYFGKLRDVEILLQTYEGPDQDMANNILKILYATEEDFVQVDEHGNEIVNDGTDAAEAT
eukprot:gb/GECG01016728.1/.p1 GENE.gb/GECG01016728.1/~~gb/GECG01016728.1/.p1  ORF type:complete len:290 (+),score=51.14 gb/GECG01016728.1/:1-870(+)